mmetsp:Transcript_1915/g.7290  ORF Transcript_1915/g.7290 Transcript_1915/m.7290 type:complete len:246 (+) Transcript_1915:3707-4444(+)
MTQMMQLEHRDNELGTELSKYREELKKKQKEFESLQDALAQTEKRRLELDKIISGLNRDASSYEELEECFSATGCQNFVIENALRELELSCQEYLDEISDGTLKLELSPSRETKGNESGVEKIEKIILTQNDNRDYVRRTLRQLSGGQRHRISLSFSLGFLHLIQNRRCPRMNTIVFDESLLHLDSEGKERFVSLSTRLGKDSVFFITQTVCEEVASIATSIDLVRNSCGSSDLIIQDQKRETFN